MQGAARQGRRGARHLMVLPAYDQSIKASHLFNLLDARGVISVTERQGFICACASSPGCCAAWLKTEAGGAHAHLRAHMAELLLELFSEEIPARMQTPRRRGFRAAAGSKLKDAGLKFDRCGASPRRAVDGGGRRLARAVGRCERREEGVGADRGGVFSAPLATSGDLGVGRRRRVVDKEMAGPPGGPASELQNAMMWPSALIDGSHSDPAAWTAAAVMVPFKWPSRS